MYRFSKTNIGFPQKKRTIQRLLSTKGTTTVKSSYSSIKEFAEYLQNNESSLKREVDEEESFLQAELISSSSGTNHLVLYDSELILEFTYHDLFGDATYSIRPDVKGTHQIFILMGKKYMTVSTENTGSLSLNE